MGKIKTSMPQKNTFVFNGLFEPMNSNFTRCDYQYRSKHRLRNYDIFILEL